MHSSGEAKQQRTLTSLAASALIRQVAYVHPAISNVDTIEIWYFFEYHRNKGWLNPEHSRRPEKQSAADRGSYDALDA